MEWRALKFGKKLVDWKEKYAMFFLGALQEGWQGDRWGCKEWMVLIKLAG